MGILLLLIKKGVKMKYVVVEYPDSTDISGLVIGNTVTLDNLPGQTGEITNIGQGKDPAQVDNTEIIEALKTHAHDTPAATTSPAILP